jgi:imidazolonepropionase-like amidohydrolase
MQIKNKIDPVKNHVYKHRAKYVAGAMFIIWMAAAKRVADNVDWFLESKGIDPDELWCPEAYEEKQSKNKEQ